MKNSYWSPRPEARHHFHLHAERRTPSPHKKQQPAQDHQLSHTAQTLLHKREREDYSDGSSTDSAPTDTYYEQSDLADGFHSIALSPESPPEYEKGLKGVDYIPKSPIYPHQMFIQMFQMKTPSMTSQMKMLKKTTQIQVRRTQDSLKNKAFRETPYQREEQIWTPLRT